MTHVAKLGKCRGRVLTCAVSGYVGPNLPTCSAHGKGTGTAGKTPTAVKKRVVDTSATESSGQAFGTLIHVPGTPGAIGNSKSATCLAKYVIAALAA